MSLIVNIPDDIGMTIVWEWLNVVHLGLIDCSLLNSKLRRMYHRMLPKMPSYYLTKTDLRLSAPLNLYAWIYARGIKLRDMIIRDCCFLYATVLDVRCRFELVSELHIHCSSIYLKEVMHIAHICPNFIVFKTTTPDALHCLSPELYARLTSLEVMQANYSGTRPDKMLVRMKECHNLTNLVLNIGGVPDYSLDLYNNIVAANSKLISIDLSEGNVLEDIISYCPLIERIELGKSSIPSIDEIGRAISSCLFLKRLSVRGLYLLYTVEGRSKEFSWHLSRGSSLGAIAASLINMSAIRLPMIGVTHDDLLTLLRQCDHTLQELILYDVFSVDILNEILTRCDRLSVFAFTGSEKTMDAFQQSRTSLKHLEIGHCTLPLVTLEQVICACPFLEKSTFYGVQGTSDDCVRFKDFIEDHAKKSRIKSVYVDLESWSISYEALNGTRIVDK